MKGSKRLRLRREAVTSGEWPPDARDSRSSLVTAQYKVGGEKRKYQLSHGATL